jgi:hypothetical protein
VRLLRGKPDIVAVQNDLSAVSLADVNIQQFPQSIRLRSFQRVVAARDDLHPVSSATAYKQQAK